MKIIKTNGSIKRIKKSPNTETRMNYQIPHVDHNSVQENVKIKKITVVHDSIEKPNPNNVPTKRGKSLKE